jgi:hypothetical protein
MATQPEVNYFRPWYCVTNKGCICNHRTAGGYRVTKGVAKRSICPYCWIKYTENPPAYTTPKIPTISEGEKQCSEAGCKQEDEWKNLKFDVGSRRPKGLRDPVSPGE